MKKSEIISYFGTAAEAARKIGVTRAALTKWEKKVPILRQYQIERITGGELKVDE